jgi:GTP 3',8-cyclase
MMELPELPRTGALLDRFGRLHSYLRISVTDRCNYRCVYCMPAEGLAWMPRKELLTYDEIGRLVGIFAGMGVRRVRLTGGEPTVRRDILELVRRLGAIPGIEDLAMTTNGHLLGPLAGQLAAAGLRRVNISIDSLDPDRFSRLTRGGNLAAVLQAIDAAVAAGLCPVKLNMVVIGGENDAEILAMARYAAERAGAVELRFIEYMPFGDRWHSSVPSARIREILSEVYRLTPATAAERGTGAGPARCWLARPVDDPAGDSAGSDRNPPLRLGFISPITEHFCASCNRLRLLADGQLRTCLAHEDNPGLRDLLRGGASDAEISAVIRGIVDGKPAGHEAEALGGRNFQGVMTAIGG